MNENIMVTNQGTQQNFFLCFIEIKVDSTETQHVGFRQSAQLRSSSWVPSSCRSWRRHWRTCGCTGCVAWHGRSFSSSFPGPRPSGSGRGPCQLEPESREPEKYFAQNYQLMKKWQQPVLDTKAIQGQKYCSPSLISIFYARCLSN